MTTPHHSEPAREAGSEPLSRGQYLMLPHAAQKRLNWLEAQLSASPAPAASGGLEAGFVSAFLRIAAQRRDVPASVRRQILKAVDIIAALAAPAATGGEAVAWIAANALPLRKDTRNVSHMAFVYASESDSFGEKRIPLYTHPAPSETGASVGVRVKALDWSPDGVIAETPFGAYSVGQTDDDKWTWTRTEYPYGFTSDPLPTEAEAKATAQSDYETRIRAALEVRSDG